MRVEFGKQALLEKFSYLLQTGLQEYERKACEVFDRQKLPVKTDDNLIEQIIPKGLLNDWISKKKQKLYYVSNAISFLKIMRELFDNAFIENFANHQARNGQGLVVYNYYHFLRRILFDSIYLLRGYELNVEGKSNSQFTLYKNPEQCPFTMHWFLNQVIFGQVSLHSSKDTEPYLSLVIIRQMVELRIRRAFGLLGWYNKKTNDFEAMPMRVIFDVLTNHQHEIDFSVPFCNIKRIYNWASEFLHFGRKGFLWESILVKEYLDVFMNGKETPSGFDRDNGITFSQRTLSHVQKEIKETIKDSSKREELQLFPVKPQALIVD